MPDVTQNPAYVRITDTNVVEQKVQFGEAVQPGNWVYKHTDGKYYKGSCITLAKAAVKGMSLSYALAGEYGYIAKEGATVQVGGSTSVGETYYISDAGKMKPYGDLDAFNDYVTSLMIAQDHNGKGQIRINDSGIQYGT
jgi:hypothetical protein